MTKQEKKIYIGLPALFIALVVAIPLLVVWDYRFFAAIATAVAVAVGINFTGYTFIRRSLWEGPIILVVIGLPVIIGLGSCIKVKKQKTEEVVISLDKNGYSFKGYIPCRGYGQCPVFQKDNDILYLNGYKKIPYGGGKI